MKERAINFKAPMVRATLEDRKTQDRREIKQQPGNVEGVYHRPDGQFIWTVCGGVGVGEPFACPYGKPGDRLWVREIWSHTGTGVWSPRDIHLRHHSDGEFIYQADEEQPRKGCWFPSTYMPRWASRITLEITDVRMERLQDISEEDAQAEGFHGPNTGTDWLGINQVGRRPSECFEILWEEMHGRAAWDANPWIWAVTFKRVQP